MRKLLLIGFALWALGCEDQITNVLPSPSPEPSPTPTPVADLCQVRAVNIFARVDGEPRYSWGLGEIAILRAVPVFLGDQSDAEFDPTVCPQVSFFDWNFRGDAQCVPQGNLNGQEIRADCDGAGQLDVFARPAGYENIQGHAIFKVQGQ